MRIVIGLTPTWDGHGSPMRTSVGRPITTVDGRNWPITAGVGFPAAILDGGQPGVSCGQAAIKLAGRHCLRAAPELFTRDDRSAVGWISTSTSVPNTTILWTSVSSA